MKEQTYFQPSQTIVLREMWNGKIWSARPEIIVQNSPELMAFYIPEGTVWKQPQSPDGSRVTVGNRFRSDWILKDVEWVGSGRLSLKIPVAHYAVLIFHNLEDSSLRAWYINLEDPLHRSRLGFDFLDQFLDIVVSPDLSKWYWKDEDDLEEAVIAGLVSREKARAMYAEGEQVVRWLQSGKSPFNGWENWQPDPSWQIPNLPDGWDIIE